MANTFTQLYYHCIWSTKKRERVIGERIAENIWALIAATAKRHNLRIRKVGGIENHVHTLIEIPKTLSVSEAMKRLKAGSSNAINKTSLVSGHFAWQDGYAAYTVSSSGVGDVVTCIANQRDHHREVTFEEEFLRFLEKHGVDYDPNYLWD